MLTGTEVLTTAQMRAIESAAIKRGEVTGLELMERAGAAVVAAILAEWPEHDVSPRSAIIYCGPGNNGGDGFVIARLLHQRGWRVHVGFEHDPDRLPPDARENYDRWQKIGEGYHRFWWAEEVDDMDGIFIDAGWGIGTRLPFPQPEMITEVDTVHGFAPRYPKVAVDLPSGVHADTGKAADDVPFYDLTVTFHALKPGHMLTPGAQLCGKVVVADIGLQRRFDMVTPRLIDYRGRNANETFPTLGKANRYELKHKYDHGHALILAGGPGKGGAARLTARGALRVGAGLVTICPAAAAMAEHLGPPDALMRQAIDSAADLAALLEDQRINALCLGPGAGVERAATLLPVLLAGKRACVLDADALTALAGLGFDGLHEDCVLTPHLGEFARLFPDIAARLAEPPTTAPVYSKLDAAREAAARSGATILLKGPDTVIAAPDGQAAIHSAFDIPWLATAGSGDVLAGIITGLLARRLNERLTYKWPAFGAAATGARLHAAAARRFGPGLIADDLPDQLPGVFRDLGI